MEPNSQAQRRQRAAPALLAASTTHCRYIILEKVCRKTKSFRTRGLFSPPGKLSIRRRRNQSLVLITESVTCTPGKRGRGQSGQNAKTTGQAEHTGAGQ